MAGKDKPNMLSKQEASIAYALIERLVPFPCEALARHAPLQYKFCQARARATSVHPGCAHAHVLTLASSRLYALKMNYSDLLGVFPNLMFILSGASGDGKSIPLWLDTMVMHMYRKKEHKIAMAKYKVDMDEYKIAFDAVDPALREVEPLQEPKNTD